MTERGETDKISRSTSLELSLKGIYPDGRCRTCKSPFKWNKEARLYECPEHHKEPKRFYVIVQYKGERIKVNRDFHGRTLRNVEDAHAIYRRAEQEKTAGKFDPKRWKGPDRYDLHPGRLYVRWYKKKFREMKNGQLKPSYVVKLKSYYRQHFRPFAEGKYLDNIQEIKSTQDFFDSLHKDLSPRYRRNMKRALATFFHWVCDEQKIIDEMPFQPKITVRKYIPQVLDLNTRLFIVDNFVLPEHRPILGFYTVQGCRPGEVIVLKGNCIKEHPTLGRHVEYYQTLSEGIVVDGPKDDEARANPIFKLAEKYLPEKVFSQDFIFKHRNKPYTLSVLEHQLMNAFKRYNKAMRTKAEAEGATWEDVRVKLYEFGKHSRSSELYEAGASLVDLQKYHGHSKPETSLLYTKIDVLKRFRKFDNVEPFRKPSATEE